MVIIEEFLLMVRIMDKIRITGSENHEGMI